MRRLVGDSVSQQDDEKTFFYRLVLTLGFLLFLPLMYEGGLSDFPRYLVFDWPSAIYNALPGNKGGDGGLVGGSKTMKLMVCVGVAFVGGFGIATWLWKHATRSVVPLHLVGLFIVFSGLFSTVLRQAVPGRLPVPPTVMAIVIAAVSTAFAWLFDVRGSYAKARAARPVAGRPMSQLDRLRQRSITVRRPLWRRIGDVLDDIRSNLEWVTERATGGRRIPPAFAVIGVLALLLGAPFLFGRDGWTVGVPVLEGVVRLGAWIFGTVWWLAASWIGLANTVATEALDYWDAGARRHSSSELRDTVRAVGSLAVLAASFIVFVWAPYRLARELFRRRRG